MKFLYHCFTALYSLPVGIAILLTRYFGDRRQIERLGLGLTSVTGEERSVWFVASSVGEVNIAVKLIHRLKEKSVRPVVLTVTTKTGRRQAEISGCGVNVVSYHPLDVTSAVRRFLRAYRPTAIVMIETELWPMLMQTALESGVKLMQVSGRMSEKSLRRYFPFKPLFQPLLKVCQGLLMQSEEDAERISLLVGDRSNVRVIGSIKSDYVPPSSDKLHEIREYLRCWQESKLVICGSTRPGEEEVLLEAFVKLTAAHPDLRLVLAPRHLERIPEVAAAVESSGLSFVRRSHGRPESETRLLLLDTIGELNLFYHCSDVSFVGGTLVPLGGHNLLEPALAGNPVLFGPHYENQKASEELLRKHRLGYRVSTADDLAATVARILGDPDARGQFTVRSESLRQENATVLDTYVTRILELL